MVLVSPGVEVTVTDDSFFIPNASPTVPLLFIATGAEKKQPDGLTDAAGTFEEGVVRTVTSQRQLLELYGNPTFLEDSAGNQHHGDARNEYGLYAAWQFLGQGTRAYVVRANVNLDDDLTNLRALWDKKIISAALQIENAANALILETNTLNQKFSGDPFINAFWTIDFANSLSGLDGVTSTGSPLTFTGSPGVMAPITVTVNNGTISENTTASITSAFITGSPQQTIAQLLVEIQTQLNASLAATNQVTVTLVAGNVVIQSAAVNGGATPIGPTTSVVVTDDGFFADMTGYNTGSPAVHGQTAGVVGFKETITSAEYLSLVNEVMTAITYPLFSFVNTESEFEDDQTTAPFEVFPNGFTLPSTSNFYGIAGYAACGPSGDPDAGPCPNGVGSNTSFPEEWTAQDASDDLIFAGDQYKFTLQFQNITSLGANDAAKRVTIVTQLQAEVNSNTDIRSENFEYNLITVPGYHEVVDELTSLVTGIDLKEEVFVVADTPVELDPAGTVAWAQTTARVTSEHVAYYYPWQLASNLDGTDVLVSPAGTALKTYAFSDEVSELWFAPAGTRRGIVTGVTDLGYVSGTLGTPTTLVQTYLNQGQRDDLYRYFVNINPIVFFPGRGILVFGQKTVAANAQATDRVNVSRLIKFIKRQLRKNTLSFVFEPNDQLTRDSLKAVVDAFLSSIVVKRGLFDFATISDESNNTPQIIDTNQLVIDIALKPTKAAEFISIPIRIVSTGTEI